MEVSNMSQCVAGICTSLSNQKLIYTPEEDSSNCCSIGSLNRDVIHRRPRLGISAVRHTHMVQMQSATLPNPQTSPIKIMMPIFGEADEKVEGRQMNPITAGATPTMPSAYRFRPGLRPVRLIDIAQFKVRRKQQLFNRKPTESPMPKRQPLKAFQQNTHPSSQKINLPDHSSEDAIFNSTLIEECNATMQPTQGRISTNPKCRRYSSSSLTPSTCTLEEFSDPKSETIMPNNGLKRRKILFSASKKNRRNSDGSVSEPGVKYPSKGVMTRLRLSAQLTYEVMKRVVSRRQSKVFSSPSSSESTPQKELTLKERASETDGSRHSFY